MSFVVNALFCDKVLGKDNRKNLTLCLKMGKMLSLRVCNFIDSELERGAYLMPEFFVVLNERRRNEG